MSIRILLLCIALLIVPTLIGCLCNGIMKKSKVRILSNWVNGFIFCLGSFQLFVLPCVLFRTSLTLLTTLYIGFIIIISIISIWVNRYDFKPMINGMWDSLKKTPWTSFIAILIVVFQMGMYFFCSHMDMDDAFYVATAVTTVDTNTIYQYDPYTGIAYTQLPMRYVLSPFSIFHAVLSQVSGVHATILVHSVLPVVYLGLAYAVYTLLGYDLFRKDRKATGQFIIWIAMISMFLNATIYTQSSFMLLRIWQGKAFLAAVLLPYVFYLGYRKIIEKETKREWFMLLFVMLACTMVSSMGIMLGAIMTGVMGILLLAMKKDVKSLLQYVACCIPNVVLSVIYLMFR